MAVRNIEINNFRYGIVDMIRPRQVPRGGAVSSLNWLTRGTFIELRRGQAFLGTNSIQAGLGNTTGIKKVTDSQGVEHLFGSYGKKVKYYDISSLEWIENGSDILGPAVVDSNGYGIEPITFSEYVTNAGNQLFINSPHSAGFYKVMIANPGSNTNVYDSSKNFLGNIKIDTNRTFLWGTIKDATGMYGSYIDTQIYTTVTAEAVGSTDGSATYTGTLAFKAGGTKRTCFAVAVTVGSITFTDNFNGVLTGSDGSTGTINYTTGVIVINFVTAPGATTPVASTYQWEDSTNNGIADFTKSGTRTAGQGFVFRQDEGGGALKSLGVYNQIYYCFHIKTTWALNIGSNDTTATNLPFRQNVGSPAINAVVDTGSGMLYVDTINKDEVRIRILTYTTAGAQQVVPIALSNNINLKDYRFDNCAAVEWGDLILFSCGTKDSVRTINGASVTSNNRVLVYNKLWKSWDVLDYNASCFAILNGGLVAGDSISNNFMSLFDGFDDLGSTINNYWIGNADDFTVMPKGMSRMRLFYEGLKLPKKLLIRGLIVPDQSLEVYLSADNSPFVLVGTISGKGSYVDANSSVTIGSTMLGEEEIGGQSDGVNASPYECFLDVKTEKAEAYQIKIIATGIGYISVESIKYWDLRAKGKKVPRKYRNESTD